MMSLAAARSRLRLTAAVIATSWSTYGGRAIATSSQTDQQEGRNKSTWTKIKFFLLPAFFFYAGTERVFSLLEKSELAEQWKNRLKSEAINCNEIESLDCVEFRKLKCKGVFDEKKSILVVENTPSDSDPFAYQYSLLTPFIPLPAHPQSVCSPLLVNRGRVPRDWADYRKIEKFQSHEIVRDFPQKEHLSTVSYPHEPVESLGVIRTIVMKLQKHLSSGSRPQPQPQPRRVELLGVIRSGVYSEWLRTDVGTLARAVGLDPEATLYVEQIQDMSDGSSNDSVNTVATPYHDADMLGRFATMRKEHMEMITLWYCCSAGALYMARWLMRKPL